MMVRLFCSLALLMTPVVAVADDTATAGSASRSELALTSTWDLSAGWVLNDFETEASYTSKNVAGAFVRFEDSLGFDASSSTFNLRAEWHYDGRGSVELEYTDIGRTGQETIAQDIDWGDYVFRADGEVRSRFDSDMLKLAWQYDLASDSRLNTGFSLGLATFDIEVALEGEARLVDDQDAAWIQGVVEGTSFLAPVPLIGFFLDWAATESTVLRVAGEVIDLSISGHRGRVNVTRIGYEYVFRQRYSVGLGISSIDIDYRSDDEGERLSVRYRINSVGAFAGVRF